MRNFLNLAEKLFLGQAIPILMDLIRIPSCSPGYAEFHKPEETEKVVRLMVEWAKAQPIPGISVVVKEFPGATSPLIYINIPASDGKSSGLTTLYAHGDKQPPFPGWKRGLSPYKPVIDGDKLYGRGGADDLYGMLAALLAIRTLHEKGVPYGRCVILVEFCEESGSRDLPTYIQELRPQLGGTDLIVCLDSGAGDYNRVWLTTSLRGVVTGILRVATQKTGMHSGHATGIVPSAQLAAMQLISRLVNLETNEIHLAELHAHIPQDRRHQAAETAKIVGKNYFTELSLLPRVHTLHDDIAQLMIANTWEPGVEIVGTNGVPAIQGAGNTMLPFVEHLLSVRIPPTLNPEEAFQSLKKVLEKSPPYNTRVSFTRDKTSPGWNASPNAPWLTKCLNAASKKYFGNPLGYQGQGGTIPFIKLFSDEFPAAELLVTGLLGPASNAHSANESMDIPMACRLTATIANVAAEKSLH